MALKRAVCVDVIRAVAYLELVYLVTALVPSETACLASSQGSRPDGGLDLPGGDGGPLVVVS